MDHSEYFHKPSFLSFVLAFGLIFSVIGFIFSTTVTAVRAGTLLNASDLLSSAAPGDVVTHSIGYTSIVPTASGETIKLTFDPQTDQFGNVGNIVLGDVSFAGATLAPNCSGGAPDKVTLSTSTGAGDNSVIFTVCAGDSVPSGTKSIVISNRISNPTSTGSYLVRVAGSQADSQDIRVAIIDKVVLTAGVDANFTFTVGGVASGTTINGVTTTFDSASTTLAFGTLPVNVPITLGQTLAVTSNARNGFAVTVHEDQNLGNGSGGDIDLFPNGEPTSTPVAWYAPSSTFGNDHTYGHFGLTSDDSDLQGGAFAGSKFVGDFQPSSTQAIFSHSGPSDGVTQDKGVASVAYRVQIGVLQEAGTAYSNYLYYVATPTF